jgi:hypothetical protein
MHIFLADTAKPALSSQATALEPTHAKYLISYAYRAGMDSNGAYGQIIKNHAQAGYPVRLILDSGAFTAFTTGKTFTLEGYRDWILEMQREYAPHLDQLHYLNLDVIGNQVATWQNQTALERMGLQPVPILTHTSTPADLERIIQDGYTYFALGGLVVLRGNKPAVQKWLNRVYKRLLEHWQNTGKLIKTHLLGCTWVWLLENYPCYTSDSSTWLSCLKFGKTQASGLPYLPLANQSQDRTPQIHTLRCEIRKAKLLERHVTSIWKARGIEWSDHD